jgi:hypothetical protein
MVRVIIRNCNDWRLQSIAVICNSLAELDIQNPTVFAIVKQKILKMELA